MWIRKLLAKKNFCFFASLDFLIGIKIKVEASQINNFKNLPATKKIHLPVIASVDNLGGVGNIGLP
jgi:hypothetical protein